MAEREKKRQTSIRVAANLLKVETDRLKVETVTWRGRNKVQATYKKLMNKEEFQQSIEMSRPDVGEECRLIFTPHLDGDECLRWVFPGDNLSIQSEGAQNIFRKPCFEIDPKTGDIPVYWNEKGDIDVCGYD